MISPRHISSNRALLNSIALLMVVAFAWQACGGELQLGPTSRGDVATQRLGNRALIERSTRFVFRKVVRQREVPAAALIAARRELTLRSDRRAPGRHDAHTAPLAERLLDLPPPAAA